MCGILGALSSENDSTSFKKALNLIHQRGPDGFGVWEQVGIQLGHKRLSILDLSEEAHQPMIRDHFVVVFNGEVFNFLEIRKDLESLGHVFRSNSDTEVILMAFIEWGEEAFQRFNGMWAIALYNTKSKELLLSRDRYGIKPLYYYHKNETLYFASEVKAFYPLLKEKAVYNQEVIDSLIINQTFQYHGTDQSYLKDVFALENGHNLKFLAGKLNKYPWYKLNKVEVADKFEDRVGHFRDLLFSSCSLRLRSDVPLATSLSGGLDSSTVAAIISNKNVKLDQRFVRDQRYEGFCASFPNSPIDESVKAQKMADSIGLKLNIIDINNPSIDELEEILEKYDGPSNTLAFYPIAKLYQEIKKKGITVSLDGQGPDEMLAGYWPVKQALQSAFNAKNFSWFADIYETYVARTNRAYFNKGQIRRIAHEVIWKDFVKRKLKGEPQAVNNGWVASKTPLPQGPNSLENKLLEEFFQNPLPGILNQYDRCSMISSVECRMPYMDYRIVEYLFSIPSTDKISHGYTKYILRMAAENLVTDDIRLEKVKYGFNAPILDWFNQGLGDWMGQTFNSKDFEEFPYFDGKKVQKDFQSFRMEKNQNWQQAWAFWSPFHIFWWHKHAQKLMKQHPS